MKYHIITLGCQMNISDSERIASVLESIDYKKTPKRKEADLIIINMCSVRQSAVDRVYGKIREFSKLKEVNPNLKVLLTGCILKKDLRKFKNSFDYILSIKTLNYWKNFLEKDKHSCYLDPRNPELSSDYLKTKSSYSNKFSSFIPISIGCNNFCSYCVVPYTKGSLIHRNHKKILEEVKEVIKKGSKEIWLLGQNVNSYQSPIDSSINFSKLLEMINNIKGNFWIRFTSSHPKDFSKELIKTMKNSEKVTEYLNLPIQAGDNEILKKMNRSYTVKQYKNLVKEIGKEIPDISLSTDVIVGFPAETKKQFQNTVKLFKEIKFDMAYIAQYSPRPGTAANKMKDDVSHQEKERRKRILTETLKEIAEENNKKYINKTVEVLVDKTKKGFLIGKTRSYKTVRFKGNKNLVGQFTKVKIINVLPWGLKGK